MPYCLIVTRRALANFCFQLYWPFLFIVVERVLFMPLDQESEAGRLPNKKKYRLIVTSMYLVQYLIVLFARALRGYTHIYKERAKKAKRPCCGNYQDQAKGVISTPQRTEISSGRGNPVCQDLFSMVVILLNFLWNAPLSPDY